MLAVTVLLCVFNFAGVVFYTQVPNLTPAASMLLFAAFYGVLATVSLLIIWCFWRGHNWARWLVFATSILAILNLLGFPLMNRIQQSVIVLEAALGAWLIYWLNTQPVTAFFKRPPEPRAL